MGSIYLCQQGSPVAYVIKLIMSSIRQVIFLTLICSLMTFELFLFRFKTLELSVTPAAFFWAMTVKKPGHVEPNSTVALESVM